MPESKQDSASGEVRSSKSCVSIQPWQPNPQSGDKHTRSSSMDSLESSGSSSSGSTTATHHCNVPEALDFIPTRTIGKAPKVNTNALQFVKVLSPLYKKTEPEIPITQEVKMMGRTLKEGEEEWQSNLDNWKSRRRKISEKVIQRAEEMKQIEAEEQLRQEHILQQQRKIKKFSEIVEKRSRSYNLDLYISPGQDSGLGGTPEPDDIIDSPNAMMRSDTSEGMTSEAESIDSDFHKSDKVFEKILPKVPQKPSVRDKFLSEIDSTKMVSPIDHCLSASNKDFDNLSSTDPSDIDGATGDSEPISSEEELSFLSDSQKSDERILSEESCDNRKDKECSSIQRSLSEDSSLENGDGPIRSFTICIKPGDNRGFGFSVKGGKDQNCLPYIDNIVKFSSADTNGLNEGDRIISLNGENAADYSHALLLFSIKQAVYTGVIDIVVNRPEEKTLNTVPVISKISSRKSAFAEKLAMFSKSTSAIQEDAKLNSHSLKSDETKSESLVLKRRSAFENGRSESSVTFRRSSYISQSNLSNSSDTTEKRYSSDYSLIQYNRENVSVKKGPPPPVPLKPKLKPKTNNELVNPEPEKVNGYKEDTQISILNTNQDATCFINGSFSEPTPTKLDESNQLNPEDDCTEIDTNQILESINENIDNVQSDDISSYSYHPNSDIDAIDDQSLYPDFVVMESANHDFELNPEDTNIDEMCYIDNSENYFSNDGMIDDYEDDYEEPTESFTSLRIAAIPIQSENDLEDDSSRNIEETASKSEAQSAELLCDKLNSENTLVEENCTVSLSDTQIPLSETEVISDAPEMVLTINTNNYFQTDNVELQNDTVLTQNTQVNISSTNCSTELRNLPVNDSTDDCTENAQINSSPLCLPLEKIEEDDVISASTTTSSETPDTETVIETIPSNVSPLPNDESNGEESKIEPPETPIPVPENKLNPSENPLDCVKSDEHVPIEITCSSGVDNTSVHNERFYPETLIEEYNRELDESIDQITSLDVIDELEQRLMQQLEEQDDVYEVMGIDDCLSEADKQWFYYDESGLLDDLTPRNLEPPKEPPPPPPPDQNIQTDEDVTDQKVSPFSRVNSTRRIKKELWRRRSDFLGLDSPESIDVDTILPPPPGLEEILKQEREQNQWLEKRMSLAEADTTSPLYATQSLGLEQQSYNVEDFCSDYFLDETIEDQWQENADVFEPTDAPSPPSEGKHRTESPLNKAKQNIQNLGAAPKAKIMDSNKWITEKSSPVNRKTIEPVFRQASYNQNYWLAQDDERKRTLRVERRYSAPHPDVTIRTWGDRENEFQNTRSTGWNSDYQSSPKLRTDGSNCDIDTLESEMHKCSSCGKGLCEGSAMGIEALRLYFHIECFSCCLCRIQLGNGSCGTDVQVKNNQLYCPRCFTVD